MAETRTEALHRNAEGLDIQAPEAILVSLADAQIEAAKAVRNAIPAIAKAAEIIAGRLSGGGKLAYAAAGSSGLMALADALELPGTFGIPRDRIRRWIYAFPATRVDITRPTDLPGLGETRELHRGVWVFRADC